MCVTLSTTRNTRLICEEMKWIGKKKRRILMGFLNQNFAPFFLKFHELLFRSSKDEEEEGRKDGRKQRGYICVRVCPMWYCV